MRKEFCEKGGILITYTNDNVCFEDTKTAESILLSNDGKILHSNFDDKKNQFYMSVAKTKNRNIKLKNFRIEFRSIFIIDTGRTSAKHNSFCIFECFKPGGRQGDF